jgi:ADP-dependent NAD(P)H-hydrate dehydratase / NAD(P)H-hydrate epimerase
MEYWFKQSDKPLFPDIEWNKPERRDQAGRLLVLGGSRQALSAPAESYELANKAGIGQVLIALPDKVKRLVGSTLPDAVFLPSTSTGEFNQDGESELLDYARHSDTLLLPGDVGRNSQTTILLEQLLQKYTGELVITRDALDLITPSKIIFSRPHTTIVASLAQLQKLLKESAIATAITFTMDLVKLVDVLHELTASYKLNIITFHQGQFVVASNGNVSTTKKHDASNEEPEHWRTKIATLAACYLTWNPQKQFEALTYTAFMTAF